MAFGHNKRICYVTSLCVLISLACEALLKSSEPQFTLTEMALIPNDETKTPSKCVWPMNNTCVVHLSILAAQ